MSLVKTVLLVPAVVSGVWMAKEVPTTPNANVSEMIQLADLRLPRMNQETVARSNGDEKREIARRLRIDRVLGTLEEVSEVTMQMQPESQARIEPVLAELAEQTLQLAGEDSLRKKTTDDELDQIEASVDSLINALSRQVEPEISL